MNYKKNDEDNVASSNMAESWEADIELMSELEKGHKTGEAEGWLTRKEIFKRVRAKIAENAI